MPAVRIHAANIAGLGAVQLVQSLLPAMERSQDCHVECIYLPDRGPLADYQACAATTRLIRRKRYLPNALSRILECTLFGGRFNGPGGLLVLGDIPIRCTGPQTVFVQTPLLMRGATGRSGSGAIKYGIARYLFRFNSRYASAFIVQTEIMKAALISSYPMVEGRVHVIGQPVPEWLLRAKIRREARMPMVEAGLRLFYPAASYPHKNHQLLRQVNEITGAKWPISSLILTLPPDLHPNPAISWIKCVGRLEPEDVNGAYSEVDGLLFLSRSESFGFPLLEAMWTGIPVICPDLPYAHVLCGDQAIYFDPENIDSLSIAVRELRNRLDKGWWPDWRKQLENIPSGWDDVAEGMLKLAGA